MIALDPGTLVTIGQQIRSIREMCRLDLAQVADRIGLVHDHLAMLESGHPAAFEALSLTAFCALARSLGTTASRLLGDAP